MLNQSIKGFAISLSMVLGCHASSLPDDLSSPSYLETMRPTVFIIENPEILQQGRRQLRSAPGTVRPQRSSSEPSLIGSQLVIADAGLLQRAKRKLRPAVTAEHHDFRSDFTRNLENHAEHFRQTAQHSSYIRTFRSVLSDLKTVVAETQEYGDLTKAQLEHTVRELFRMHQAQLTDVLQEMQGARVLRPRQNRSMVNILADAMRQNFILAEKWAHTLLVEPAVRQGLVSIIQDEDLAPLGGLLHRQSLLHDIRQGVHLRHVAEPEAVAGRTLTTLDASCVEGFYGLYEHNPSRILDDDGTLRRIRGKVVESQHSSTGLLSYLWPWKR